MEKFHKATTIYCYSACLIMLIGLIFLVSSFVKARYDAQNPVNTPNYPARPELASHETFRASLRQKYPSGGRRSYDDAYEILIREGSDWKMYQAELDARKAAVDSQLAATTRDAHRTEITSGVVGGLCLTIFLLHFIWVRKTNKA